MAEEGKKRKGFINEDDASLLIQRYNSTTILTLLQEVFRCADGKMDWNTLVKQTSTGITSAREYQMLWRHIAYKDALLEKLEDGAEPLDDDSDLDFELEAVPSRIHPVSAEDTLEVASCVKALTPSYSPPELGVTYRTTVESPLTSSIPNDQITRVASNKQQLARNIRGTKNAATLSNQKPLQPAGSVGEALDGSGPPKKKRRRAWTEEEDMGLIAAVQKCGEGNWSDILKGEFKHDRDPQELSQRWAVIRRKRLALLNQTSGGKVTSSASPEERKAAQKAFSMALGFPMTRVSTPTLSGAVQSITKSSSLSTSSTLSEAMPASAAQSLNQVQPTPNLITASQKVPDPSNKTQAPLIKPLDPTKAFIGPNASIKAAAVAAGGRIATPSTAASLLKAAQSKNAVHIKSHGQGLPKFPFASAKPSPVSRTFEPQTVHARTLRPSLNSDPSATALKGVSLGKQLQPIPLSSESNASTSLQENKEHNMDIVPAIGVDEFVKDAELIILDNKGCAEHRSSGSGKNDHESKESADGEMNYSETSNDPTVVSQNPKTSDAGGAQNREEDIKEQLNEASAVIQAMHNASVQDQTLETVSQDNAIKSPADD
ncbi:uncharacterized protein LOC109722859 [Ananas comosus]|uniref:Uncharacterized protein LOC109722859 n=1 Tax=Ananas comosus TaxID=4615 RepID=A0A6P5GFK1_ANACO|nr:uncharacterized protein LOC109722859 [Ananas comosus]